MNGDATKLPCSLCKRTRPPRPNDEVKTLGCALCGYSLPASADARDPRHTALMAAAERQRANNAKVSVPGAIVDKMLDGRNQLITQLRECLAEWFDEDRNIDGDEAIGNGMRERARAALKASENWKAP